MTDDAPFSFDFDDDVFVTKAERIIPKQAPYTAKEEADGVNLFFFGIEKKKRKIIRKPGTCNERKRSIKRDQNEKSDLNKNNLLLHSTYITISYSGFIILTIMKV